MKCISEKAADRTGAASQCRLHSSSSPRLSVTKNEMLVHWDLHFIFLTDKAGCIRNVPLIALFTQHLSGLLVYSHKTFLFRLNLIWL